MPLIHPYVLLISGPAGAGKTTVAREWAETRPYPCAHVSLDVVRRFVRSGFADPNDGFDEGAQAQFKLARHSIASMARNYVSAGISCVIDDVVFPEWELCDLAGWQSELSPVPVSIAILLPTRETIVERNSCRKPPELLTAETLETIYNMMSPWNRQSMFPVIDNSELGVPDTLLALEKALNQIQ